DQHIMAQNQLKAQLKAWLGRHLTDQDGDTPTRVYSSDVYNDMLSKTKVKISKTMLGRCLKELYPGTNLVNGGKSTKNIPRKYYYSGVYYRSVSSEIPQSAPIAFNEDTDDLDIQPSCSMTKQAIIERIESPPRRQGPATLEIATQTEIEFTSTGSQTDFKSPSTQQVNDLQKQIKHLSDLLHTTQLEMDRLYTTLGYLPNPHSTEAGERYHVEADFEQLSSLERILGKGSFVVVTQRRLQNGTSIAVKQLTSRESSIREYQHLAAAQLNKPDFIQTLLAVDLNGPPYSKVNPPYPNIEADNVDNVQALFDYYFEHLPSAFDDLIVEFHAAPLSYNQYRERYGELSRREVYDLLVTKPKPLCQAKRHTLHAFVKKLDPINIEVEEGRDVTLLDDFLGSVE
ncbi:unnamed protein product, partial [Owenia fusiformis]